MTDSTADRPVDQNPAGVDTTRTSHSDSPKAPHERDEQVGITGGARSATAEQAARDVKRGLEDTSRGEASDDAYQKQK